MILDPKPRLVDQSGGSIQDDHSMVAAQTGLAQARQWRERVKDVLLLQALLSAAARHKV